MACLEALSKVARAMSHSAGHGARCFEPGSGRLGQEAKGSEDGFKFSCRGSAEEREAGERLRYDGIDGLGNASGAGYPCAAFGRFERESRVEESCLPCCEDLGEVFRRTAQDNVIDIRKEMDSMLDMWGECG